MGVGVEDEISSKLGSLLLSFSKPRENLLGLLESSKMMPVSIENVYKSKYEV